MGLRPLPVRTAITHKPRFWILPASTARATSPWTPSCRTGSGGSMTARAIRSSNANFTDVPAELKALHDEHIHAMISVWGMMDATSKTFQEIKRQGFEIPGTHVYDPTNPPARDLFWERLPGKLFAQGWMHSGWIVQSRKSTGRTRATRFCAINSCTSAAASSTPTFFRWSTHSGVQEHGAG